MNDPTRRYLNKPAWVRYLLASAIFAVVLAIRLFVLPVEAGLIYLAFFPGIAVAALFCGVGPGLFFLAASTVVSSYILFPPHWNLNEFSSNLPATVAYVISALVILGMVGFFHGQTERRIRRLDTEISERRRFESESAENSARMAAIVDSALDAIISVDIQQQIVLFNPAAEKMFGYPAIDVLDTPIERLIPERFRQMHAGHMQRFYENGESGRKMSPLYDLNGLRSDGEEFPIEASISMSVVARRPVFTVILRDVSDRRQAEEALDNSRRQLKTLIEQTPISIAMLDSDMNYLFTSRRWLEEYGRGNADLTGLNLYEVNPDVADYWKPVHQKALAGVSSSNDEELWVRADGSRYWVRWAVHPWANEAGGSGGILIFVEDVTRHKKTAEALKAIEDDLIHAQTVGAIGSWRLDVRRNELHWSAENYRIFGVPEGAPMNYEAFLSQVHPEDRSYVDRMWRDAIAGKPYDIEHRLLVGEKVKWVREKAELEFDREGVLLAGFGITQDITEKRLVENQLKAANDRLAKVADERAAHLRELSGELTQAEQLERDRLYELLHDHVQPLLVATRLVLSGLSDSTSLGDMLHAVGEAKEQVSSAIQTARLLSYELSPPLIRERGLLPALESLCRWVRLNYGLDVDLVFSPEAEPASMTIRLLCFNAVRELLINVVKYAATRRAIINLDQESPQMLRIRVQDNGVGFDPADGHYYGSGLSNFRRRLAMVGGSLVIESSPGNGTTATLLAPLDLRNAEPAELVQRKSRHPEVLRYQDFDEIECDKCHEMIKLQVNRNDSNIDR